MLTTELIKAQTALSALTDEQIDVIAELSKNDENTVIGQKLFEVHTGYDNTIFEATGIKRDGAEKSYDYAARVGRLLKEKADNAEKYENKIKELQNEKNRLQKVIDEGGADAETAKQLKQTTLELLNTKEMYNDLKAQYENAEKDYNQKLFKQSLDSAIGSATTGIIFKAEIPKQATDKLLKSAIETVKGFNPDFADDGNGGKTLVFRNADGSLMNNPDNKLNPFTATELITRELKNMGVLHEDRVVEGAGTNSPKGKGGNVTLDVSDAKTQREATDIISQKLMTKGLFRGSNEFQAEFDKVWAENNITVLPIQ